MSRVLWTSNGSRCPHCGVTGGRCWFTYLFTKRACCKACKVNGAKSTHYR